MLLFLVKNGWTTASPVAEEERTSCPKMGKETLVRRIVEICVPLRTVLVHTQDLQGGGGRDLPVAADDPEPAPLFCRIFVHQGFFSGLYVDKSAISPGSLLAAVLGKST